MQRRLQQRINASDTMDEAITPPIIPPTIAPRFGDFESDRSGDDVALLLAEDAEAFCAKFCVTLNDRSDLAPMHWRM